MAHIFQNIVPNLDAASLNALINNDVARRAILESIPTPLLHYTQIKEALVGEPIEPGLPNQEAQFTEVTLVSRLDVPKDQDYWEDAFGKYMEVHTYVVTNYPDLQDLLLGQTSLDGFGSFSSLASFTDTGEVVGDVIDSREITKPYGANSQWYERAKGDPTVYDGYIDKYNVFNYSPEATTKLDHFSIVVEVRIDFDALAFDYIDNYFFSSDLQNVALKRYAITFVDFGELLATPYYNGIKFDEDGYSLYYGPAFAGTTNDKAVAEFPPSYINDATISLYVDPVLETQYDLLLNLKKDTTIPKDQGQSFSLERHFTNMFVSYDPEASVSDEAGVFSPDYTLTFGFDMIAAAKEGSKFPTFFDNNPNALDDLRINFISVSRYRTTDEFTTGFYDGLFTEIAYGYDGPTEFETFPSINTIGDTIQFEEITPDISFTPPPLSPLRFFSIRVHEPSLDSKGYYKYEVQVAIDDVTAVNIIQEREDVLASINAVDSELLGDLKNNYDSEAAEFTKAFRDSLNQKYPGNTLTPWEEAVLNYMKLYQRFASVSAERQSFVQSNLLSNISPHSGTPDSIRDVLEKMGDLQSQVVQNFNLPQDSGGGEGSGASSSPDPFFLINNFEIAYRNGINFGPEFHESYFMLRPVELMFKPPEGTLKVLNWYDGDGFEAIGETGGPHEERYLFSIGRTKIETQFGAMEYNIGDLIREIEDVRQQYTTLLSDIQTLKEETFYELYGFEYNSENLSIGQSQTKQQYDESIWEESVPYTENYKESYDIYTNILIPSLEDDLDLFYSDLVNVFQAQEQLEDNALFESVDGDDAPNDVTNFINDDNRRPTEILDLNERPYYIEVLTSFKQQVAGVDSTGNEVTKSTLKDGGYIFEILDLELDGSLATSGGRYIARFAPAFPDQTFGLSITDQYFIIDFGDGRGNGEAI